MKNKRLLLNVLTLSYILLLCVLTISAESNPCGNDGSFLGTFKQGSIINLIQTCDSCTYVNISSVTYPDSTKEIINSEMTKSGTDYNYSFNGTTLLGCYSYSVYGDKGGTLTSEVISFQVTPSGFIGSFNLYLVILVILGGIIVLGFSIREAWLVVFGGLGMIMLGIYSVNNGIVGFRDTFMTWGISLFEIGIGAFLSISSAWQEIEGD